jgi:hypothetical protein
METKNNSGAIFKNNRKPDGKMTHPDYSGNAVIENKRYLLSAWVNKSKDGKNYLRIYFIQKDEKDPNPSNVAFQPKMPMGTGTSEGSVDSIMIDDLPF